MISWIIAAYDEEKRLLTTLDRLSGEFGNTALEVIVSDDGSNDRTWEIAEAYSKLHGNIKVITSKHKGRGAALRKGLRNSTGDIVVFSSADIVIPRDYVMKLLTLLGDFDMILLSKHLPGSMGINAGRYRRALSLSFNLLARLLWGLPYKDTQGVKIGRAIAFRKIVPYTYSDGFLFDLEVVIYARRIGCKIIEVPWTYAYSAGSKVGLGNMSCMILELLWLRIRTLSPFSPQSSEHVS